MAERYYTKIEESGEIRYRIALARFDGAERATLFATVMRAGYSADMAIKLSAPELRRLAEAAADAAADLEQAAPADPSASGTTPPPPSPPE